MSLATGETVTGIAGRSYRLGKGFPPGGQGSVFLVEGEPLVGKFYHENLLSGEKAQIQRRRLEKMIQHGQPSAAFVWPVDLVDKPIMGYIMERVPPEYVSLMKANWDDVARVNFRTRLRICYRLVDAFASLHMRQGYAYCDLSSNNVLCHPSTGDCKIIDNDNLTIDGIASPLGVVGTYRYVAPELEAGTIRQPNIDTDLHSLAVLIFETLLVHHPLLGDAIVEGPPAIEAEALGRRALYVYHPTDVANRYTKYKEWGGVPIRVLPKTLQQLFQAAFVDGLHRPVLRVRETRWRRVIVNLLDTLIPCPNPKCSFKYTYLEGEDDGTSCVWCGRRIDTIKLLKFTDAQGKLLRYKVMADGDWLAAHHCKLGEEFNFTQDKACGRVERDKSAGFTLRNVSKEDYLYYHPNDSTPRQFPPTMRIPLRRGYRVQFGANGALAEIVT